MSTLPLSKPSQSSYNTDYHKWVEETVKQLQNRNYEGIDWEHLIEEVADLSGREKDKLMSLLTRLFEHFLKVAYWESEREYNLRGWLGEIQNFRIQLLRLFKKSPSLKPFMLEIFDECYQDACKIMSKKIGLELTDFPTIPIANPTQALDENWFPLY